MNKTIDALKLAEEALKMYCEHGAIFKPNETLAAIREALADHIAASGKVIAEPVEQEPVAVISESAIGLVKLHSNGACLPFGTQLYAAPVDAKAIRADALEEAAKLFDCDDYRSLAAAIRGLK